MKSFFCINLLFVLLILLCNGNFAIAEDDEYTVYVSEDAQVRDKYSETNYGSDETLGVGKYSTWGLYRSWLKFNLTTLSLPEGTTVASAKLHIYHHSHFGTASSEGVYSGDDNWTESNIKWSNQPSFSDTPSTTFTPTNYDWYILDVTSLAKEAYEGDKTLTFVLRSEDESASYWAGFRSKEYSSGSYKAYLTVTATPEPASILLFGAGLGGLAWYLRRRKKRRVN